MGFLRILGDSARILGDSRGFSGFPRKLYEVSGVSNPSVSSREFFLKFEFLMARPGQDGTFRPRVVF